MTRCGWTGHRRRGSTRRLDPGRVSIFEGWESQTALEAFRRGAPDTEQRLAMLTVPVQAYDIAEAGGGVRGEVREWIGRTDSAGTDEIGAAGRSNRTTTKPSEKGTATMKLTTTVQVSVDGVMQGPGGPEEDERGRFERGGWAHFDDEASTVMDEIFQRADAFLFGRRTYEIFAGSWGTWDDPGDSPIWTALNTLHKYVASTTLTDPRWTNTTVLSGDVAAAVDELKAKPGRELQVHGSGALFRWLFDNQLVDEMTVFIFPVVVGQGTRLFPDTGHDRALELVESRATPSGVTIQVYRPTGRPEYATATK